MKKKLLITVSVFAVVILILLILPANKETPSGSSETAATPQSENESGQTAAEESGTQKPAELLSSLICDIDSDGISESCRLSCTDDSFIITAFYEGEAKYRDTFASDGEVMLLGTLGGAPQIIIDGEYHRLLVTDNHIIIEGLGTEA